MADQNRSSDSDAVTLRHLRELVAALEHRMPHIERQGEKQIAQDASALKERALRRIAELEKQQ
jgi:phosphopentomutase